MCTRRTYTHARSDLELCADVRSLESHGGFLTDFKVPRAEHLYGQQAFRFIDAKTLTEGLGHAGRQKQRIG